MTPPPVIALMLKALVAGDTVRVSEELKAVKPEPAPTDADASPNVGETTPCPEWVPTYCRLPILRVMWCIDSRRTYDSRAHGKDTVSPFAELVFIHPSGEDGERLAITEKDTILGREPIWIAPIRPTFIAQACSTVVSR